MKIMISCSDRSIEVETDCQTHSATERKELFDRMYNDAINYILHGIRPTKEGGVK